MFYVLDRKSGGREKKKKVGWTNNTREMTWFHSPSYLGGKKMDSVLVSSTEKKGGSEKKGKRLVRLTRGKKALTYHSSRGGGKTPIGCRLSKDLNRGGTPRLPY